MSRRYLRFAAKALAVTVAAALLLFGLGYASHRYTYPYGVSHCCLLGLGGSLRQYAQEHHGRFPAGGICPEASLSLLDRDHNGDFAEVLCGKTKSAAAAKALLQRGEPLGPDTCDWHYVEGLTLADDPRLAIVWDKVGLGHAGQRLPQGGHSICRLDGMEDVIPESAWPQFLKDQERLMAARTEAAKKGIPALTAKVRLPTGKIVDHFDAPYTLIATIHLPPGKEIDHFDGGYTLEKPCSTYSSNRSGQSLDATNLRWWTLFDNGTMTLTLSLNGWKSKPAEVRVSQRKVIPNSVIFEMQTENTP
jgi:hypothetical protein